MSLQPPISTGRSDADRRDPQRRAARRRTRLRADLILATLESHRASIAVDLTDADAERILERLRAELGLD